MNLPGLYFESTGNAVTAQTALRSSPSEVCVRVCLCEEAGGPADEASHWDTGRPNSPQAQLSAPPLTGFILIAQ